MSVVGNLITLARRTAERARTPDSPARDAREPAQAPTGEPDRPTPDTETGAAENGPENDTQSRE